MSRASGVNKHEKKDTKKSGGKSRGRGGSGFQKKAPSGRNRR